jgi:hypothetical protein
MTIHVLSFRTPTLGIDRVHDLFGSRFVGRELLDYGWGKTVDLIVDALDLSR